MDVKLARAWSADLLSGVYEQGRNHLITIKEEARGKPVSALGPADLLMCCLGVLAWRLWRSGAWKGTVTIAASGGELRFTDPDGVTEVSALTRGLRHAAGMASANGTLPYGSRSLASQNDGSGGCGEDGCGCWPAMRSQPFAVIAAKITEHAEIL